MSRSNKLKRLDFSSATRIKRIALAICLFAIAYVGISYTISANNHTEKFLVAQHDLPAGSKLDSSGAVPLPVNLSSSASGYFHEGELPAGSYLLGPIRSGQLIPKSMLASAVIDERVPIVVTPAMGLAVDLVAGSSVDLWVTPTTPEKTFGTPFVLVMGAEVATIKENNQMFENAVPSVELWVPIETVPPVLAAIANQDRLSLVLRPTAADG